MQEHSLPQIFMEVPYPGSYRLLLPTVHTNAIFWSTNHRNLQKQYTKKIPEVAHLDCWRAWCLTVALHQLILNDKEESA